MMMEPDLAGNPTLIPRVGPQTVGEPRCPRHPLACFGKWNGTASWGFHERHRREVFTEIFGVV